MEFYLEILIKWLILEEHIKDSSDKQTAFFYVLHQIAKLSALCLLFTTRLIEQVPIVINQFFYFLEKKKFNQQQYQDFLECISSTVNEYSEVPIDLLQILLSNLCKNKKDNLEKQAFDVAFNVIKENKTILGNKIREFIIPKHQNKEKKSRKKSANKSRSCINETSSIIDISLYYDSNTFFERNNYLRIIKELSKISSDFLLKLLTELNNEGLNFNKKYFSYSSFDILPKILSNYNSFETFKLWKLLCNNYFNYLQKDLKDNENEFDIKYKIFKCAIKFLSRNDKDKLKENNIYLFIKDSISFFLKNLTSKSEIDKCLHILMNSLNWSIISFCLVCFLSTKNNKKNKLIKEFFFNIIENNILSNLILQDFKDKKTSKMLNTLSKPFNLILSSFDNIAKLYQLSLNDNLEQDENLNYIINKTQNIFDNGKSSITIKLMTFFYMSIYNRESMTIWYTLLHVIFTDNKEEEEKIKILNCIKFDNESEINDLINFFNQYIIFVDENSNYDSIKVLISILFTLEIFLCSIHYRKDTISNNNKNMIYKILNDVIKICLNNNIINKDVYDIICKIILLTLHLCVNLDNQEEIDINLKQKLNEILFKEMSTYVFINEQIKPKYYVKLISTYYRMKDNLIIKDDRDNVNNSFLEYPNNCIELLKKEKKINCLCFLNELPFYKIDEKFLDFYYEQNLAENIMNIIENEIKEEITENKNELFNDIDKDSEQNQKVEILTKKLLKNIKLSTEIIKYELNYLLKKKTEDEKEKNENIKNYIKTIFNNIFELINSLLKNGDLMQEKEKSEINNESFNKKRVKGKKEKKKKKSEKKEDIKKRINQIEDIININYLKQYIDLLFYMCEIGISFSFRKLVKLSNLMLVKDIRIRNYFILKVHNSLIKLKKSHRNLSRLYSLILLGLSDPNENIEKNIKEICDIFLDMLKLKLIKYEGYLNNEGYIYIPEIYIFYLIIYFIFNDHLNIYYQQSINNNKKSNKYFMNIFCSY